MKTTAASVLPALPMPTMPCRPVPAAIMAQRCGVLFATIAIGLTVSAIWRYRPDAAESFQPTSNNIESLKTQLKSSESEQRRQATWAIAKLGPVAESAIEPLTQLLNDTDHVVRSNAGIALCKIGRPAVPAMIEALTSNDDQARRAAAATLENIGPDAVLAVPALISALEDVDPAVASNAKLALVRIGSSAVRPLTEVCQHPSDKVRLSAIDALGQINFGVASSQSSCLLSTSGHSAVSALIVALEDDSMLVRERAVAALGQIGPVADVAVPDLIRLLEDDDTAIRSQAADALGQIRRMPHQAVPALSARLDDAEPQVRMAAAHAIGLYGAEAQNAVNKLFVLLHDPAMPVRTKATSALYNIVKQSVTPDDAN